MGDKAKKQTIQGVSLLNEQEGFGVSWSWSCLTNLQSMKRSSAPGSTNTPNPGKPQERTDGVWVKALEGSEVAKVRLKNNPLLTDKSDQSLDKRGGNDPHALSRCTSPH